MVVPTMVGFVANTAEPVPVSSVNAVRRLALEGVARNAVTPAPVPLMPVDTGRPVQLVSVPDAGVPSTTAVSVLLLSVCVAVVVTTSPEPLAAVAAENTSEPVLSRTRIE